MITNWKEISIELFKEIFELYWDQSENTVNKVLEVQNIYSLSKKDKNTRIYFGAGILITEWKEYNKDLINILEFLNKNLNGNIEINKNSNLSMCILEDGNKPIITPFGTMNGYKDFESLWYSSFDYNEDILKNDTRINSKLLVNPISLWYNHDVLGNYVCSKSDKSDNRKVRVRCWDLDDWKNTILEYIKSNNINALKTDNDIDMNKIVITS